MLVLRICLLALIAAPAHADDQELRQKIVGTWKLVSVVYEDQAHFQKCPIGRNFGH